MGRSRRNVKKNGPRWMDGVRFMVHQSQPVVDEDGAGLAADRSSKIVIPRLKSSSHSSID